MTSTVSQNTSTPATPTVDPRELVRSVHVASGQFSKNRTYTEDWEDWMQWNEPSEHNSPQSSSEGGSPVLNGGNASLGSTSPSEAESLPVFPLTPVYRIPSIDDEAKRQFGISDTKKTLGKKRKAGGLLVEPSETRTRQPKGQKISHNVIEKRYRTNLNDKIARLRDSVPILKSAFEASQKTHKPEGESCSEGSAPEDQAATPGLKFNKATVLTKATEYIEHLERTNAKLLSENSTLRRRFKDTSSIANEPKALYFTAAEARSSASCHLGQPSNAANAADDGQPSVPLDTVSGMIPVSVEFQRLRAEASSQPSYAPDAPQSEPVLPSLTASYREHTSYTPTTSTQSPELIDFDSVKGVIPVPDYVKRNRIPISQQQHYSPDTVSSRFETTRSDTFVLDDEEPPVWWPRNRASKLLLGSLAGLMIMEGISVNKSTAANPGTSRRHKTVHKRSFDFLPDDFYTESRGFRAQIRQRIIDFAQSEQGQKAIPFLMLASIVLGVVCASIYLSLLYLGRNKSRRRANSVSSNPEQSERVTSTINPYSIQPNMASKQQHSFLTETIRRLHGCWRILTEGIERDSYGPSQPDLRVKL